MRIAVDAMGGDNAPDEIIKGVLEAKDVLDNDDELILVGDRDVIESHMSAMKGRADFVTIVHAPEIIAMDDSPVEAIRRKRKSSIAVMAKMASHGEADAVISAGNTGACVAGCQLRMRNLAGVNRPGIAAIFPTFGGPVAVCDIGANVSCKPINLYQYAIMASVYLTQMNGVENPRVALMGIGAEAAKGNELVKKTRELILADERINFIGNIEGRDLLAGACDVAICEGFVGNIVLKLTEGAVSGLFGAIKKELMAKSLRLAMKFKPIMMDIYKKYDYHEFGGAILLGVNGTCVICHGDSKSRTIRNAVKAAKKFSSQNTNDKIVEYLESSAVETNE